MSLPGQSAVFRIVPPPQVFLGFNATLLRSPPKNLGGGGSYGDPGIWRKQPPTQVFIRRELLYIAFPPPPTTPVQLADKWRVTPGHSKSGVFRHRPEIQTFSGIIANRTVIVPFEPAILSYKAPAYWQPPPLNWSAWTLPPQNWAAVIQPYNTPLPIDPEIAEWRSPYSVEYQAQPANNPWPAILASSGFNPFPKELLPRQPTIAQWQGPSYYGSAYVSIMPPLPRPAPGAAVFPVIKRKPRRWPQR